MKESDEKILQGYLQGKDKVSSAYAELYSEKTSAELDDRILQAARKAVEGQTPSKKHIPYQAYSIAASVCLMVLAASLFLNNEEQLTSQTFESQAIPQTDSPLDNDTADNADAFQGMILNFEIAEEVAEDSAVTAEAAEAQQTPPAPQANQNQTEQPAQEAVATRARLETVTNAAADEALQEDSVNDFAANSEAARLDTSYRENVDTWLAEIQRIQAIEPAQAEEEIRLFTEAYPDIDLENRLDEINENIEINQ